MEFIKKYDNYLSHENCDYIVNMLNTRKDLLYEGITTGGKRKDLKVSKDLNLIDIKDDLILSNKVLPAMRAGITKALLLYNRQHSFVPNHMKLVDIDDSTLMKVLQHHTIIDGNSALCHVWEKGEGFYNWHMDLGPSVRASARILVCMFYLNDVEEGGETAFYHQNMESKPTKGSLVIFPADWTHLHRGNMPISNTKYICNFWLLRKNPLIEKLSIKENWKQYEANI
tara:strand:+ start:2038 stop:2718 length:681 start_codon:yes stop_codon:yes gene_type:complete